MARTVRAHEVDDVTASALRELWARAADADGVRAVSEAFRLTVGRPRPGVVHLLRRADGGGLVGYAQVMGAGTPDAVAELVVDPAHRRRGHGRALLDAALDEGARSVWAHGLLPAAGALARAAGLETTRSLHRMTRPLTSADAVDPPLPPGLSVRAFEPGHDDEAWVRLNAAAFAGHPEQGRLTLADLRERMAQPWFDPRGLRLVVDDATGDVVAFHWTKVEARSDTGRAQGFGTDEVRHGTGRAHGFATDEVRHGTGEVYVVGVDPASQGRGLGGPVTRLGLAHLARLGLGTVELYVDGDNEPALATYRRLGFADAAIDVVHGLPPQS